MDRNIRAFKDAKITLTSDGKTWTTDVYSEAGCDLVNTLALKQAAEFKTMYQYTWQGIQVIQFPNDLLALQQLVWSTKPNKIIEIGIAHGGQLIFLASLLQSIGAESSKVIGVDVEIRNHNRENIENHHLSELITLVEGSSIISSTVETVKDLISPDDKVLVILDSNHTFEHVEKEIALYNEMVSVGSYLVVMDAALGYVGDIPRGNTSWFDDNPIAAIDNFLDNSENFVSDAIFDNCGLTSSPKGALKKIAG